MLYLPKLILISTFLISFINCLCNDTTHKTDLCNLAVDNPESIFTQVDKTGNGIVDEMEYKEACEIGYQEEQFCILDAREPFGVLGMSLERYTGLT